MLARQVAIMMAICSFPFTSGAARAYFEAKPIGETQAVDHFGDAIDDPALWIHPERPEESLILGTDKQRGINVYSLTGKLEFSYGESRFNNVDIRYDFPYKGRKINLIAATRHDKNEVELFTLDHIKRKLLPLNYKIKTSVSAYGLCLYRNQKHGSYHLFVTSRDQDTQQFKIQGGRNGVSHTSERIIPIASKNEGCVADDALGFVYIAEEHKGIWKLSADAKASHSVKKLIGSVEGNEDLAEDIEGLALYHHHDGGGYLVASVQGLDSFAVFDRVTDQYLDSFKIVAHNGIDGVSHTDGIEIISTNLGYPYEQGIMIVQDDVDRGLYGDGTQNFKLVSWKDIAEAGSL